MFAVLGCKVVYLKRVTMGPLVLDPSLKPGEYWTLREEELKALERKINEKTERIFWTVFLLCFF